MLFVGVERELLMWYWSNAVAFFLTHIMFYVMQNYCNDSNI